MDNQCLNKYEDSVLTLPDIFTVTDIEHILLPHYVDRVRF